MADYRLYFLDRDERVEHVVELDCADDAHALNLVADHDTGGPMELWQLARRVKVFPAKRDAKPPVEARPALAC